MTALLVEPAAERQELMDQLMVLVYDELRRMARRRGRARPVWSGSDDG